jgi:hypothetical protein
MMSADDEFRNTPPRHYLSVSSPLDDLVADATRRAVMLRDDLAALGASQTTDVLMIIDVLNMMSGKVNQAGPD